MLVGGIHELGQHVLKCVPVPLALFEQLYRIVQTVFVDGLAVIDNGAVVAGDLYCRHIVLAVPDHAVVGILYICPQLRIQIQIVVVGNEHAANRTLGECVPVAGIEKVNALVTVDGVRQIVVPCAVCGLVPLNLSAVAFLKDCQLDGCRLSGVVRIDVPCGEPLDGLVLQFAGQTLVRLRQICQLFPCCGGGTVKPAASRQLSAILAYRFMRVPLSPFLFRSDILCLL